LYTSKRREVGRGRREGERKTRLPWMSGVRGEEEPEPEWQGSLVSSLSAFVCRHIEADLHYRLVVAA
jgi:hypothetical protein